MDHGLTAVGEWADGYNAESLQSDCYRLNVHTRVFSFLELPNAKASFTNLKDAVSTQTPNILALQTISMSSALSAMTSEHGLMSSGEIKPMSLAISDCISFAEMSRWLGF